MIMYFVYMVKKRYHLGKRTKRFVGREDEVVREDRKDRLGNILKKKVDIDQKSRK